MRNPIILTGNDDEVQITVYHKTYILKIGGGGLAVHVPDGKKIKSRMGGSSCIRARNIVLIDSRDKVSEDDD